VTLILLCFFIDYYFLQRNIKFVEIKFDWKGSDHLIFAVRENASFSKLEASKFANIHPTN